MRDNTAMQPARTTTKHAKLTANSLDFQWKETSDEDK